LKAPAPGRHRARRVSLRPRPGRLRPVLCGVAARSARQPPLAPG